MWDATKRGDESGRQPCRELSRGFIGIRDAQTNW